MALKIKRKLSWKQKSILATGVLFMGSGGYLLSVILAPEQSPTQQVIAKKTEWNKPIEAPSVDDDRIYVPKLKLNLTYRSGGEAVPNDHAWWRHPDRGSPASGGNFILAAHRFVVGLTHSETTRRSPFYHVDDLHVGNHVYVDHKGVRYKYEITKKFKVEPTQTEIENPSKEPIMTIYTCDKLGHEKGREVLIAKQVAKDVDISQDLEE